MKTKIGPAAIDQEQAAVDYSVIDGAIGKVFPGELEQRQTWGTSCGIISTITTSTGLIPGGMVVPQYPPPIARLLI